MFYYIVAVTHNTGHGISHAVIYVTDAPRFALAIARQAEKQGFEFYSEGTGSFIYRLEHSQVQSKESFKFVDKPPLSYPVVYSRVRTKDGKSWKEEWFDAEIEKLYGNVSIMPEESKK
jgi:hypothetical protein